MKKPLFIAVVLSSVLAFAMCSDYATCPHDGGTAALI